MWSTVAFIQNNCDMPCDVMVINNGVMVLLCYVGWGSVGDTKISHVVIYLHSLWWILCDVMVINNIALL